MQKLWRNIGKSWGAEPYTNIRTIEGWRRLDITARATRLARMVALRRDPERV